MKIRPATRLDLKNIAIIHAESWRDTYKEDLPAEFLQGRVDQFLQDHWRKKEIQNQDVVLVAQEQSLVGFVAIWCRPTPLIDNLHVRKPFRSRHIGTDLMREATKELLKKEHTTASLWAFNSNKKAIRFYERLGGQKKERLKRNVLGFEVLSQKLYWPDITLILKKQAQ